MPYLFVHFREKTTPDGEQVYFGLSRDGYHWNAVNEGKPVLWAYYGDKGVRDHTIIRTQEGRFFIFSTDLSLSYGMRNQYHHSWEEIGRSGSNCLSVWESDDLVNWTEQRLQHMGDDGFGCVWAPDIFLDPQQGDYVLHWSSSHVKDDYRSKCIWYARTRDFRTFTKPAELYRNPNSDVIDSAIYVIDGVYYLFVKNGSDPAAVQLLKAPSATGPWELTPAFDKEMARLQSGQYEAPTLLRAADGKWCLFLDYYGVRGAGQGYVPFVAEDVSTGEFIRSDKDFSFPYGFKHGTILSISEEEYQRISQAEWPEN